MSIQSDIEQKVTGVLQPIYLQVINESDQHNVPPGSESHFKVVVVSDQFEGKRSVARHQMLYGCLKAELDGPVHALALHTYTEQEWQAREGEAPASPECLGGSKSDQ